MMRSPLSFKLVLLLLLFLLGCSQEASPSACKYDFTVYVYPLSPELAPLKQAEEARQNKTFHICQKCILEQFALEYVVYDFFTQFCGRTFDPEEADYFYLPIVREIGYRLTLPNRSPSQVETVLIQAIEKNNLVPWREYLNVTDHYWKRNSGADHIIAMPAPVTNLRHPSLIRGFAHYMIQLMNPIFLNVEFSKSFVEEYPVCAREKNIVMPYPSTDPDVLRGQTEDGAIKHTDHPRDKLIFYQGGRHGACEEIRVALATMMRDKSIAAQRGNKRRDEGFGTAKFCPVPIGDSPSSKRMYDVMHYGCVPVILSDDLVYAYSLEAGGFLNASSFSIRLPQKVVQKNATRLLAELSEADMGYLPSGLSLYSLLRQIEADGRERSPLASNTLGGKNVLIQILSRVPEEDLRSLQSGVRVASGSYRYYLYNATMGSSAADIPTSHHKMPDGTAIEVLAQVLSLKKKKGIVATNDACQLERRRPGHKYVHQFPCEFPPAPPKKKAPPKKAPPKTPPKAPAPEVPNATPPLPQGGPAKGTPRKTTPSDGAPPPAADAEAAPLSQAPPLPNSAPPKWWWPA